MNQIADTGLRVGYISSASIEMLFEVSLVLKSSSMTLSLSALSEDVNMAGVVAAVVVICLVIAICGFGGYYAHRNGYFRSESVCSFLCLSMYIQYVSVCQLVNTIYKVFVLTSYYFVSTLLFIYVHLQDTKEGKSLSP